MSTPATNAAIRVFISYAWEDNEYRDWVAQLAAQLRGDGVDARLDRWHLQAGQTIPEFMNSEVRLADKVLVLCSPKYRQKVHAMEEGGPSTGSGWESMLLNSAMFSQDARSKAITALALGKWLEAAPDYMLALPYDDLTQTDETNLRSAYTSLLRRLTGTSETAPPLQSPQYTQTPEVSPLFGGPSLSAATQPTKTDHTLPTGQFSGKTKISFCSRLGNDWNKLADYFEITPAEQARFSTGEEARAIWAWLENRTRLKELPMALTDVGRQDLAPLFTSPT